MRATPSDLAAPVLFGVATGLRSTVPLALLAAHSRRAGLPLKALLAAAALGELVADKLPTTPSRLLPGPLGARIAVGALGGALLGRRSGSALLFGVLGAVAAVGGALAGYSLRQRVELATGTADLPWALLEDGVCVAMGAVAAR